MRSKGLRIGRYRVRRLMREHRLRALWRRKFVGWAMAPTMHAELVCAALQLAIAHRQPAPGLIVHSDWGS